MRVPPFPHPASACRVVVVIVAAGVGARVGAVDFAHEVVPILRRHCTECHAGGARQGGFSLDTRESLLAGGDSGRAGIVPGSAVTSELVARITSADPEVRMPGDGAALAQAEIDTLRTWIDEQAPWEPGFTFAGSTWEPPLALREASLPPAVDGRSHPVDRIVDAYLAEHGVDRPPPCDDRTFIRRASLDLVGLLPTVERVDAFVADRDPGKRGRLVHELLAADVAYADHWLSFWNDLLRNDYTGTGYITGGRRQITAWLHRALRTNLPFDRFVRELVAPGEESRGFIDGIVWRGTVNANQTVPIQFAQNISQTFLGINLKCASCHDSFVDRWTLRQTYDLAAIAAAEPLELARCDKATGVRATPAWIFPDLGQVDPAKPPAERLAELASLMTNPGNGWLSRTLVNRLWHRLMGRGIVHPVDSLRSPPWSPELLDLLAADLVKHAWDVRHVLETIATSEIYAAAMPAVDQSVPARYVFAGPIPRRLTAEQFTDAVWQLAETAPQQPDTEVIRFDPAAVPADAARPASAWIWTNDRAESAPGEKRTFRATFTLPRPAVHAVVVVAADNEATVFVNGRRGVAAGDWKRPASAVVTADLVPGTNTLLAAATNAAGGGPAAIRVELRCRLVDESPHTVATDGSWTWTAVPLDGKGSFEPGAEPTDWAPAAVVADQSTWATADGAFASAVSRAVVPGPLPMVRAAIVKATPLMAALGRPNRDQVVTSRPTELTTLEAILLANEPALADELVRGGGRILVTQQRDPGRIIAWIFAAALARPPTTAEAAIVREMLGEEPSAEGVADLLWSVLVLPEFQLVR